MLIKSQIWLVVLLLIVTGQAHAWYDNNWHYRVPLNVPAGAAINSVIKVDVDFAAQLTALGVVGSFDTSSPRVVRSNDTSLAGNQEFTDAVYAAASDSIGNSRGEVRFILQDEGPVTYFLYFDIVANGPKAANPQTEINGNFEADSTGTVTPSGWSAITRSDTNIDMQVRPSETVTVNDTSAGTSPATVNTNGTPNSGNFAYLMGFRSRSDSGASDGTNATLTRNISIPASNPGNFVIRFKPQGWDSGNNNDLSRYDFLQVRLLNTSTSAVLLNIVGPQMNNYKTCPFSPNYGTNTASSSAPGYGPYNNWDNGKNSNNHTQGMTSAFNRGAEPWVNCSAALSSLAGQTVRLEIRMGITADWRAWFLLDDVEWSVVSATLGTPQSLVVVVPPSNFNAFDTATPANSVTGVLKTKIAGEAFSLDVVALSGSPSSVLSSFSGAVKVELVDGSGVLGCSAKPAIQVVSARYSFTAADLGRHSFTGVMQAEAYADTLVRISYPPTSPSIVVCSSDHFAIRPASFSVTASDVDVNTAGTLRTLNATSANATPFHKAGKPFTVTATAYNANGAVTTRYTGSPTMELVSCLLPGSGCNSGVLSAGNFISSAGVATSDTAQYSEVGAISAALSDSEFAQIDDGDGSTLSERTIASASFNIGRFVPDHFAVDLNTPLFSPSCITFSYLGQALKYLTAPVATITAKNAGTEITQNYTGTLWKVVGSAITPNYTEASHPLTLLYTTAPTIADIAAGSGTLHFADTVSNILGVTRTAPVAPFNAEIAMGFSLQDSDGVQVGYIDGVAGSNPVSFGVASAGNGIGFTGNNKSMRWGRLVLQNAYGSELQTLSVPLFSEYFNGTNFVSNSDDNCTALNLGSQLLLSNPGTAGGVAQPGTAQMTLAPAGHSQATLANATLAAGDAGLSFSAPGAGNTGYIDISGSFAGLSWLLFDWDHDGAYDDSPAARINFGIYAGNPRQIYLREVY